MARTHARQGTTSARNLVTTMGLAARRTVKSAPENSGLLLDHDHTDGHVRGWLCHNYNAAIGHLNDDPTLLERALRYLRMDEAG